LAAFRRTCDISSEGLNVLLCMPSRTSCTLMCSCLNLRHQLRRLPGCEAGQPERRGAGPLRPPGATAAPGGRVAAASASRPAPAPASASPGSSRQSAAQRSRQTLSTARGPPAASPAVARPGWAISCTRRERTPSPGYDLRWRWAKPRWHTQSTQVEPPTAQQLAVSCDPLARPHLQQQPVAQRLLVFLQQSPEAAPPFLVPHTCSTDPLHGCQIGTHRPSPRSPDCAHADPKLCRRQ
jgi:hypothetical protein